MPRIPDRVRDPSRMRRCRSRLARRERPLSPDGRALVDAKRGCKAMTFAELQRRLLGLDSYLHDLVNAYAADKIDEWYIRPETDGGADLEQVVRDWIEEPDALPLAIVAGYGK